MTASSAKVRIDDAVDTEIATCLDLDKPQSFFLFAGAGSGKTRSLVTALRGLCDKSGNRMRLRGQQIAVITYTNDACDEIIRRLDFDPVVAVSTIHSFAWAQIQGFTKDIRAWLKEQLIQDIAELKAQLATGRAGTKISEERKHSIEAKAHRLEVLDEIKRFIYSPTGDNRTRDSLNHSEVIQLTASFIESKPLMQKLLVSRYPVLLIDESQDTNAGLMEAFLKLQTEKKQQFALGLFGDTMQRIYADGKADLGKSLPKDWRTPAKVMNHRSPTRVIRLINRIRSEADDQQQTAREDAEEGIVRLFVCSSAAADRREVENRVRQRMREITKDEKWTEPRQVKALILEHHMAATRMGFSEVFEPLYRVRSFATGLRDGTLPVVRMFVNEVLPLVRAHRANNRFGVAAVVRRFSPLLSREILGKAKAEQKTKLESVKQAVDRLMKLVDTDTPDCGAVLRCVADTGLFDIPDVLLPFSKTSSGVDAADESASADAEGGDGEDQLVAIAKFLAAPFSQIEPYADYVQGRAEFATHQGVKGLEFDRVLVIMDDKSAGGFLFKYEKLFGAEAPTDTDRRNRSEGKETSDDRTRRLFYVTASRSKSSLALVAYSANPQSVCKTAVDKGWFDDSEIEQW